MPPQLQFNPTTNEPFLSVPIPSSPNGPDTTSHIIITPYRPDQDVEPILTSLNDPIIYKWLRTPPVPYTREHAEEWIRLCKGSSDKLIPEIEEWQRGERKWLSGCPVRAIREVRQTKDGQVEEVLLGDVGLIRYTFDDTLDESEREEMKRINDEREVGDERTIWTLGDWLASTHHGKGIMSAAVRVIMDWAMANLNVHYMKVHASVGNIGSCRVFEKNGFTLTDTVHDAFTLPEIKGGGKASFYTLRWARSTE
ncbi:hypothetical protein CIHG_00366 [Coccidioides immitis H538.4]|uniref:N-acetyltransferase domain-containing protein n=1 Tax=Coccidioides immitis H538.4 TaxID=396776 RepID=A0A0J8RBJ4_COCIT|nr:hypothetical protein CIHG_00366 [Coccidioides immitis H538.4]